MSEWYCWVETQLSKHFTHSKKQEEKIRRLERQMEDLVKAFLVGEPQPAEGDASPRFSVLTRINNSYKKDYYS